MTYKILFWSWWRCSLTLEVFPSNSPDQEASRYHHHPAQPSHVRGPGLPPRQIPHKLPNFDASAARRAPASRTSPSSAVTASCPAQGRRPYSLSLPRSIPTTSWRRPAASASTNSDDSEHRRRWRTSSSSRKRKRGAPPSRASSTPRTTTASSRSTRRHTDRVIDRLQLDHGGVLVALSPGSRNVDRARRRRLHVPPVPVSFDRWRNCYVVARHCYRTCGKVSYHDATDTWFHQDFHIGLDARRLWEATEGLPQPHVVGIHRSVCTPTCRCHDRCSSGCRTGRSTWCRGPWLARPTWTTELGTGSYLRPCPFQAGWQHVLQ
jgi:hypothetical protein